MEITQIVEFQGLHLKSPVNLNEGISVIIGKNGSGKSRLLQAISERKIIAQKNGAEVGNTAIKFFPNGLQPAVTLQSDNTSFLNAQSQVKSLYSAHKGRLIDTPYLGIQNSYRPGRNALNFPAFERAVRAASVTTGRPLNELDEHDVADFYSHATTEQMGALNIAAVTREYLEQKELNERNDFRNHKYGLKLPYRTTEEFESRFGPAPWIVFNEFMDAVFEGKYHINHPESDFPEDYYPIIWRNDGREIQPHSFSAGEKTLLWLCLSMYATTANLLGGETSLVLLDEPDATLHPQMVQKLYTALDFLIKKFGCSVLLTTHSPTTVALAPSGRVWQISEDSLDSIDKDRAIADLLDGVDQVSVHYTNRRQVYVESHNDALIYEKIFSFLKRKKAIKNDHITLSFIPASSKLPEENIRQIYESIFGANAPEKVTIFIKKINGQGNSVQVIGAVESLVRENNQTVHGIIDWDTKNRPKDKIHVHGAGVFYSIENAILNPLSFPIYLLANFPTKITPTELGFDDHITVDDLLRDNNRWQKLVDEFTTHVLGSHDVSDTVKCQFGNSIELNIAKAYTHHHGHDLEKVIKEKFPYLKGLRNPLLEDVLDKTLSFSGIKTIPSTFLSTFNEIQLSR